MLIGKHIAHHDQQMTRELGCGFVSKLEMPFLVGCKRIPKGKNVSHIPITLTPGLPVARTRSDKLLSVITSLASICFATKLNTLYQKALRQGRHNAVRAHGFTLGHAFPSYGWCPVPGHGTATPACQGAYPASGRRCLVWLACPSPGNWPLHPFDTPTWRPRFPF